MTAECTPWKRGDDIIKNYPGGQKIEPIQSIGIIAPTERKRLQAIRYKPSQTVNTGQAKYLTHGAATSA